MISASYTYDYQGHMPIGPTCVLADVKAQGAVIITSSQDSYVARPRTAALLGLPQNVVRFVYYEGGSCFGGHPGRYDAPPAAAVISQLAGKPVRLQYMRWDEHGWDAYGPNLLADVKAGVDANGKIVGYENTQWTMPGAGMARTRETTEELVGLGPADGRPDPELAPGTRGPNAYTIPNRRGIGKAVPMLNGGYLKMAPMRAPSSPNNFPAEVMIDELRVRRKDGSDRVPDPQREHAADDRLADAAREDREVGDEGRRLEPVEQGTSSAGEGWRSRTRAASRSRSSWTRRQAGSRCCTWTASWTSASRSAPALSTTR